MMGVRSTRNISNDIWMAEVRVCVAEFIHSQASIEAWQ